MPLIQPYSECTVYEQTYVQHETNLPKDVPFLNANYDYGTNATETVIDKQGILKDLIHVKLMYNEFRDIFGGSTEYFVMSEYLKMRNAFVDMSFDKIYTEISKSEKNLFIYGINTKVEATSFFTLFFEDNTVEAVASLSTPHENYMMEGDVESCAKQMSQILSRS